MKASHIIQEVISQLGPVGIDLEFLVRKDVDDYFRQWLSSRGWEYEQDLSVKPTQKSLEWVLYNPIEIKISRPTDPLTLLREIGPILSWLKTRDTIWVAGSGDDILSRFDGRLRHAKLDLSRHSKESARKFGYDHVLKVPRGRNPMNLSSGCHLHFDIDTWFESADHIERFIRLFYASSAKIKGQVVHGRYNDGSGSVHAPFDPLLPRRSSPSRLKSIRGREVIGQQHSNAISASKAHYRGDLEVRVFHSTLNIQTLTHWFNLIIELIEYSRQSKTPSWDEFETTLKDPELKHQIVQQIIHLLDVPWTGPKNHPRQL